MQMEWQQDIDPIRLQSGLIWVYTVWPDLYIRKGLGSRTCRISPINRQKIKVDERKWHSTFLCAEHFYFHE